MGGETAGNDGESREREWGEKGQKRKSQSVQSIHQLSLLPGSHAVPLSVPVSYCLIPILISPLIFGYYPFVLGVVSSTGVSECVGGMRSRVQRGGK